MGGTRTNARLPDARQGRREATRTRGTRTGWGKEPAALQPRAGKAAVDLRREGKSGPRRGRSAPGHQELRKASARWAPGDVDRGYRDLPRKRHNTPLSSSTLTAPTMHTFQSFRSIRVRLVLSLRLTTRRHEALTFVRIRQARTKPKSRSGTSGHEHPSSSIDELDYEPFVTENHRWPSGNTKIARRGPPARFVRNCHARWSHVPPQRFPTSPGSLS
jgi:hypothetical protein